MQHKKETSDQSSVFLQREDKLEMHVSEDAVGVAGGLVCKGSSQLARNGQNGRVAAAETDR